MLGELVAFTENFDNIFS